MLRLYKTRGGLNVLRSARVVEYETFYNGKHMSVTYIEGQGAGCSYGKDKIRLGEMTVRNETQLKDKIGEIVGSEFLVPTPAMKRFVRQCVAL